MRVPTTFTDYAGEPLRGEWHRAEEWSYLGRLFSVTFERTKTGRPCAKLRVDGRWIGLLWPNVFRGQRRDRIQWAGESKTIGGYGRPEGPDLRAVAQTLFERDAGARMRQRVAGRA